MGMNPYINATIIMQLMTVISERIKEIQKEGEMGRRRIQRWSRYLTVALGAGQAYGFTVLFQNTSPAILGPLDWFQRLQIILVLTAGTVMLMWFGELITEHGIGNGVSLIIFAGIIGRGPQGVAAVFGAHSAGGGLADYIPFILFGAHRAADDRGDHRGAAGGAQDTDPVRAARRRRSRGGAEGELPAAAGQPRGRDPDHLRDLGDVPADDHRQLLQRRADHHVVLPGGEVGAGQLLAEHLERARWRSRYNGALLPAHVRVHVLLHGDHV